MGYKIYSAELKISLINEYMSRNITVREFASEKNIKPSTFSTWISRAKQNKCELINCKKEDNQLTPIDVTRETKDIIATNKNNNQPGTFLLEANGITLKFSIHNLKEVLEVIKND